MSPILSTITSGSLIRGNSSIVSDNLALHYNFGIPASYSGSGTSVNNLSTINPVNGGSLFPGTITGATFTSTPPAYLSFGGNADWIEVPSNFTPAGCFEANNALSIEMWIYPLLFGVDPQNIAISSFLVARGSGLPFDLLITNPTLLTSARITYRINSNGTFRQVSSPFISINSWYHVVGTYSSNLLTIYVNNVATSLVIPTSTLRTNASGPLTIGTYLTQADSFNYNGRISEVRIYRKELSAAEVAKNYNVTRSKYGL